mgnify:CR=1 FL=1
MVMRQTIPLDPSAILDDVAPVTQAFSDVAAAGISEVAGRRDHRHGMPAPLASFAGPALVLGTANTEGVATTAVRSDATIAAFDTTAPTTSAVGDAAAVGSAAFAARRDHTHGREAFAAPTIALGSAAGAGVATTPIRSDATIAAFDTTAPAAVDGSAAAVGTAAFAARRDHVHLLGPTITNALTLSAAGTALTVNNNATISGTLAVNALVTVTSADDLTNGNLSLIPTGGDRSAIILFNRSTGAGATSRRWFIGTNTATGGSVAFYHSSTSTDAPTTTLGMLIDASNVVKISDSASRATTEGTNHLDIFDGTAPVGTLTNGFSLYSVAGVPRLMQSGGFSYAFPAITANDTLAALGLAQTFSGAITLSAGGTALTVTNNATITGTATVGTLAATTINGAAMSGTFTGTHTYSGAVTFSAAGTGLTVNNNAVINGNMAVAGAVIQDIIGLRIGGTAIAGNNSMYGIAIDATFTVAANIAEITAMNLGALAIATTGSNFNVTDVYGLRVPAYTKTGGGTLSALHSIYIPVQTIGTNNSAITIVTGWTAPAAAIDLVKVVAVDIAAGDARLAIQAEAGSPIYLGNDTLRFAATTGILGIGATTVLSATSTLVTLPVAITLSAAGTALTVTNNVTFSSSLTIGAVLTLNGGGAGIEILNAVGTGMVSISLRTNSGAQRTDIGIEQAAGGGLFVGSSAYAAVFGSAGSANCEFAANNTIRMVVYSAGGVNVLNALSVGFTGAPTGSGINIGAASTNNSFWTATQGAASTTMYIGNASINVTSDVRVKSNISAYTGDALGLFRQMNVVEFDMHDAYRPFGGVYDGRYVGLTAQALYQTVPWAVNTQGGKDCWECRAGLACGEHLPWQVKYDLMAGLYVKGFQQVDSRLEYLEQENKALRQELLALRGK